MVEQAFVDCSADSSAVVEVAVAEHYSNYWKIAGIRSADSSAVEQNSSAVVEERNCSVEDRSFLQALTSL